MKRWAIGSTAFFAAIIIGTTIVWRPIKETVFVPTRSVIPATTESAEPHKTITKFVAEFVDLPSSRILEFPEFPANFIDLHNTDGLVRKSETVAKNGEKWLVMFDRNGYYSIRASTARVTPLKTVSYPGDETDARVSFPGRGRAVFAFRNLPKIKAGPVSTVYLRPTWDEIDDRNLPIKPMETGYNRRLNLYENWYTLRVSTGLTTDGEKIGVLVLENQGVQRVIARHYFDESYGTIIGSLLWAGDIDNDGKLDLYFDEFNEKGYFAGGLYLSSEADEGELLKQVASFSYGGC